jgi:4,5-dihydroxyphthalate decarboxylase
MVPLYAGDVRSDAFDLRFEAIDEPRVLFDRLVREKEFDSAEFSASEYVSRFCTGDREFVAIPAFPSRLFRHGFVAINRRSGIRLPGDLNGKRIGIELYTQTAAVFIRGMLSEEYGVDLGSVRWLQGAVNAPGSHGNPIAPPLLRPVSIDINHTGKSLNDLLVSNEIDAIIGSNLPASLGRDPDVVRLFPDHRAVEKAYYAQTGIFPIMHLVVMRRSFCEQHPSVPGAFYQALKRAKGIADQKMRFSGALRYMLPWLSTHLEELDEVFGGGEFWPYGVEANRPTLEALVRHLNDQGLIGDRPRIESLFVGEK